MQVQKRRLQHGWSQEQLAELSGLNVRTIQRIERGQTPSVESLKTLGAVFDVDFSELKEPTMESPAAEKIDAKEVLALAYARKLKGFYMHAASYVIVVVCLAAINLITYPEHLWFLYTAFGWGVGLLSHGLQLFNLVPFLNADWERRQVEKHLGRKL